MRLVRPLEAMLFIASVIPVWSGTGCGRQGRRSRKLKLRPIGPGVGLHVPSACLANGTMTSVSCGHRFSGNAFSGTSFAAPLVLGAALNLHGYAGFLTKYVYPEVRKIVLMVGAKDANADGAIWTPGVDAKDGAGAPALDRIKSMIDANRVIRAQVTPSTFAGGAEYVVAAVSVPAGNAFRVGMAWNSCATDGTSINNLPDFDLYVTLPSGGLCGGGSIGSTTSGSEVEMLYDTCLKSSRIGGTYRIRIRQKSGTTFNLCGSETFEPIAVAWDYFTAP